jgi:hypothetical protein
VLVSAAEFDASLEGAGYGGACACD